MNMHPMPDALPRAQIRAASLSDRPETLRALIATAGFDADARARVAARAARLVNRVRRAGTPGMMESFLAEYGLDTAEGVSLMGMAEALVRVPDAPTQDALMRDKIAGGDWASHRAHSASWFVNANTELLRMAAWLMADRGAGAAAGRQLRPAMRLGAQQAMKMMGRQFVLGRTIEEATRRAGRIPGAGISFSYDMLGEAARTAADADRYHLAYANAITELHGATGDLRDRPGVSVKLSALHPRYEESQRARVMRDLVPRVSALAHLARAAGIQMTIDAEEADRLELSLDVMAAVLSDPSLRGWDGFGAAVQAYGPRAIPVIDWLHALAARHDRKITLRLVKGAYWDAEIKRAQVLGLDGFPVFTRKSTTDVSYIAAARRLLALTDRIYPQFATHNAHSIAAVLDMGADPETYEFQRLYGMGEALHEVVRKTERTRHRIYAPVGPHKDLLAYLVRRLLENGANTSFVNKIADTGVPAEAVAADPFAAVEAVLDAPANPVIAPPAEIFGKARANSRGWDLNDPQTLAEVEKARAPWRTATWSAVPMTLRPVRGGAVVAVVNPAAPDDIVGEVQLAAPRDVTDAIAAATPWDAPVAERATVLRRAADLYEAHHGELFALAAREAGKTLPDCVGELREAVDFLRYYATEAERAGDGVAAAGIFACISPWNFPLAIFTGQIGAALAAGNGVIAKPAEATPLIAARAVSLLHQAGVPRGALQLLPGTGGTVGAALTGDPRLAGVCFTGSTATAQRIHRSLAETGNPGAVLIAETGGLNAMIVDSTALPEQAVRDILASAFQSAGQRCSALRILYLQDDIADAVLEMLSGAMDALTPGAPWEYATDIGPVIDAAAQRKLQDHVDAARAGGRLVGQLAMPGHGHFVGPAVIRVGGIGDLAQEMFGPILHVATFRADRLDDVIDAINARGFGLTFGLQSRLAGRAESVARRLHVGNLYVNRNQIGAVVGSQPFGGEGLSGTGPKAGGPDYLTRFAARPRRALPADQGALADVTAVQAALDGLKTPDDALETHLLAGPTGELNRLTLHARGPVLCLGPGADLAAEQAAAVRAAGAPALVVAPGAHDGIDGVLAPEALTDLRGFAAVACEGDAELTRAVRQALAAREGQVLSLIAASEAAVMARVERHLCVDTTAAGGNAALLAQE